MRKLLPVSEWEPYWHHEHMYDVREAGQCVAEIGTLLIKRYPDSPVAVVNILVNTLSSIVANTTGERHLVVDEVLSHVKECLYENMFASFGRDNEETNV